MDKYLPWWVLATGCLWESVPFRRTKYHQVYGQILIVMGVLLVLGLCMDAPIAIRPWEQRIGCLFDREEYKQVVCIVISNMIVILGLCFMVGTSQSSHSVCVST